MRLINASFEILPQHKSTYEGIYKSIELAGRTCYKSEDKITDESCIEFVSRMIESKHNAMLEHGTVYLKIEKCSPIKDMDYFRKMDAIHRYKNNKYSKVIEYTEDHYGYIYYITTNYRVMIENN
ncbi:MAG: FAD-dependent thymidylate synthase [Methanobrevibacter sp.]|nr:FAD-dependent thymidylate synthase [Methanobrevibacter sp.]